MKWIPGNICLALDIVYKQWKSFYSRNFVANNYIRNWHCIKESFLCHWYIVGILCIKIKLDYNLLSFELRKHFKCIFQLFRSLTIEHPPRNITFRSILEIIDSMNDSQNKSFYVANNSSNKRDDVLLFGILNCNIILIYFVFDFAFFPHTILCNDSKQAINLEYTNRIL